MTSSRDGGRMSGRVASLTDSRAVTKVVQAEAALAVLNNLARTFRQSVDLVSVEQRNDGAHLVLSQVREESTPACVLRGD